MNDLDSRRIEKGHDSVVTGEFFLAVCNAAGRQNSHKLFHVRACMLDEGPFFSTCNTTIHVGLGRTREERQPLHVNVYTRILE